MNEEREQDRFRVFEPVEPPAAPRLCAWGGCALPGAHRAPHSREKLAEYRWFCLDHVRIYNRAWNYYEGMSDAEVEAHIRADTTWNRPTWPLGGGRGPGQGPTGGAHAPWLDGLDDPFGFVRDDGTRNGTPASPPRTLSPGERKAFKILDLDVTVSFEEVRARYKALVKRHHPDANNGAKDAEEHLKRINEAYRTLKNGIFA